MVYEVYGTQSGYIKSFKSMQEAKEFIKDLRRFDKKNDVKDKYYIEVPFHVEVSKNDKRLS